MSQGSADAAVRAMVSAIRSPWLLALLGAVGVLWASSLYSYLLFHTGVEVARATVLLSVAGLAWASWQVAENGYLVIYGSASFFAALIALLHALAYKGMRVFPADSSDLPTQLWIASRYLESGALVAASFFTDRRLGPLRPALACAAVAALLVAAIAGGFFPACFIEGRGLTPFKIVSEYLVAFGYLAAFVLLAVRGRRFEPRVLGLLLASIVCSVAAELAFTLYASVFGSANLVGHLFVLAAAYLSFWAILVVGVRRPQELLFRELSQREELLAQRVAERTAQLETVNRTLEKENAARRQAEQELTRLNAGLEQRVAEELAKNREKDALLLQQSRLATMGELLHNLAHQWRQPLSVMTFLLANLKDAYDNGELDPQTLDQMVDQGQALTRRMSDTVDDFRDFFVGEEPLGRFDLVTSVRLVLAMVSDAFQSKQVEITLTAPQTLEGYGYPKEFSRVLLNVLTNAEEAIRRGPGGGVVTIELSGIDGSASVTVRDSGGGIPDEVLPKMFDPYFTTKEKGTGLGLYLAKMVMENMGGGIEARNVPGGAEFVISVPLQPAAAPQMAAAGQYEKIHAH